MRVLALTSWWPEPADNGSRLRIARLLRALAQQHEVHLLALAQEPVDSEQIARVRAMCASVEAVPQRTYTPKRSDLIGSVWRSDPASVRATYNALFDANVQACAARVRPDLVIAFQLAAAPYALNIVGVPRLLEEVELTVLHEQYAQAHDPRRRLRAAFTWWKHRRYVRSVLGQFDGCTVVSEREREQIQTIVPLDLPVSVIPNGADVPKQMAEVDIEPDTLIYPGALSFDANLDAMRYFVEAILPRVQQECPHIRLRITGRTNADQRAALERPGVQWTGYVPDVRALVAQSWLEVVPLRIGGGTRLKVLEALALGTPVVSTPKGVEGLDLQHGEHVLVADTPDRFAAATIDVLRRPALRQHLAAAGYQQVRDRYDWHAIGAQLCEVAEETAARGRARL